ncbi:MAG: ABC transporter ATP-binding protein [Syntrophales bacterium]|nr:ABC transporter ATP-binding protein [Syntrophales bacterium]
MLKVKDLNVYYGTAHVLEEVSLEVEEREMVAVLGANGAGKSTLLKTISGLVRPQSGSIEFQGRDITLLRPDEIVALGITQCPEGRHLFPEMSVYKNLLVGAYIFRRDKNKIARLLSSVYEIFPILRERKEQMAGTLSGGEQQMLAIARALMSEPKLLMLDEMSLGLAPKVVENLFKIIQEINGRGITIILVEQNAAKALATSKRVYVMESGKIAVAGDSLDLSKDPKIRSAYLGI